MRMIAAGALALGLLLASCGEGTTPEPEAAATGEAAGEVLGGSISDDMLPLESLESRSPPAEVVSEGEADDDGGEAQADAPAEEEAPPAEEAAPAE